MKILKRDEKKRKICLHFLSSSSSFKMKWNKTKKKQQSGIEKIFLFFFVSKLVDGIYKMMERFFLHNNASGRAIYYTWYPYHHSKSKTIIPKMPLNAQQFDRSKWCNEKKTAVVVVILVVIIIRLLSHLVLETQLLAS